MKTHRLSLFQGFHGLLLGVLVLAFPSGPATGQPVDSARSFPPDATPYVRPALPEDLDPDGRGNFSPTVPFVVDVVVSNTDPTLKTTDAAGDEELSIAINPQNPNEIVITSFDFQAGHFWTNNASWYHSLDGGSTWTKRFAIPTPPGRPGAAGCPCDQVVDYGRKGRLFGTFLSGEGANANNVYTRGSKVSRRVPACLSE